MQAAITRIELFSQSFQSRLYPSAIFLEHIRQSFGAQRLFGNKDERFDNRHHLGHAANIVRRVPICGVGSSGVGVALSIMRDTGAQVEQLPTHLLRPRRG